MFACRLKVCPFEVSGIEKVIFCLTLSQNKPWLLRVSLQVF